MKKKRPRIAPEVRYDAVMDLIRNKDTLKNVARRNNMSTSSLWNYYTDVDAAIKKVVGLDDCDSSCKTSRNMKSTNNIERNKVKLNTATTIQQKAPNEIIIRINICQSDQ
ncbi:hypothetical protein [Desulfoplanes formicivorans]|uniref:Transposase n=1 Tax=Desulfoplanes formicivorans TaxID=1592317 RepID=A0A194ABS1_9BACT|nr:hypothetical protein [Desulfoplanes formicivorans]GAU07602.1 hypothetical protein DPF_0292 [Desulfoplanes formicivorans]